LLLPFGCHLLWWAGRTCWFLRSSIFEVHRSNCSAPRFPIFLEQTRCLQRSRILPDSHSFCKQTAMY
jgi:hypothetical protein